MEQLSPDWTRFSSLEPEAWKALIHKELKGLEWSSLEWPIDGAVKGQPFYHFPGKDYGGPLLPNRSPDWQILETIEVKGQISTANKMALEALAFGAEAIHFQGVMPEQIPPLMEGILWDMAPVYWTVAKGISVVEFQTALVKYLKSISDEDALALYQGGILGTNSPDERIDIKMKLKAQWASAPSLMRPVEELFDLLNTCHQRFLSSDLTPDLPQKAVITFEIGESFLLEVARLRAWRMVWGNWLQSWGLPPDLPCSIIASVRPDPRKAWEDTYISATTRCLSAVLGGADLITILPPEHENEAMVRRIGRNVQHLMKEEAQLNRVSDPMAGSYTVEELSIRLAETAWARFNP